MPCNLLVENNEQFILFSAKATNIVRVTIVLLLTLSFCIFLLVVTNFSLIAAVVGFAYILLEATDDIRDIVINRINKVIDIKAAHVVIGNKIIPINTILELRVLHGARSKYSTNSFRVAIITNQKVFYSFKKHYLIACRDNEEARKIGQKLAEILNVSIEDETIIWR